MSVSGVTEAVPRTAGTQPATPSGSVAVPTPIPPEVKTVLNLLYNLTGKNPPIANDPEHPDKSVVDAFKEALADGVITRKEFAKIMEDYYGIDEVTEAAWEAFTGKRGDGAKVNINELASCLRFFGYFRATAIAYSFEWFLGLDKVYIVGGKEIAPALRNIGISALLAGGNPEVKEAWEAAKSLTGGTETDQTWDWFSTILMTRYADKLKESFDFDDLDLNHPLLRRLFGEYVIRWAKEGEGMTKVEWNELIDRQKTIKEMEEKYGALNDIRLIGQTGMDLLNQAIADFRQGKDITNLIGQLRQASSPTAAPLL